MKDVGVYIVDGNRYRDVDPEVVGRQTGGVPKRNLALGMPHGHASGKIMHPTSKLRISQPATSIIRTPEGLRLPSMSCCGSTKRTSAESSERLAGGVIHPSVGAERTSVDFGTEEIASRTWRVTLKNLNPGEYGFLRQVQMR